MAKHPLHHKHKHKHKPTHKRHLPASAALKFVEPDELDRVLAPLVPDLGERRFILRCLISEGPLHHGGSNYLILRLLGRLLAALPGEDGPLEGEEVPMLLPPHLESEIEDGAFPIKLPTRALRELLGDDERALEAAIDCLTDGPPQHSLANVITVALIDRLGVRLSSGP